ncbi:MAG TPA: hypothetical protein VN672_00965 [Solirubrobacteraceae bacterium]|nr:hypothetical protein [Solirubrobacteraceae bacterium]
MISTEVQRTLVKSPPELWAEISDAEALARHLGEFGEIRITRVQPEQKVEWEADDASGSIVIKPSGWGTKVKLTVTRELGENDAATEPQSPSQSVDEAADEEPETREAAAEASLTPVADAAPGTDRAPDAEPTSGTEDPVVEADPAAEAHATPAPTRSEAVLEAQPAQPEQDGATGPPAGVAEVEPAGMAEVEDRPEPSDNGEAGPERRQRRGFFARLFGRRPTPRATEPTLTAATATTDDGSNDPERASDGPPEQEAGETPDQTPQIERPPVALPAAAGEPEPTHAEPAERAPSAAETDEVAVEQVTAVLTSVLDRLGAAHHRPFSRG